MAWNPHQYGKFKNERTQPFLDLLEMARPVEGGQVVDLGCGTGELTQLLHQKSGALATVGIDSSREMLAQSRAFAQNGLSFLEGNINTWRPAKKYDLIFSNAALQWCDGHASLLERLAHGLAPEGQLAVQMPMNHDYPTHVLAQVMSAQPRWQALLGGATYDKAKALLQPEEYARLLFKLGFKERSVALKVYGHVLASRDEVVEWVKGSMLTYFKERLDPADYSTFLDEYRQRLFQILPNEKPFFYPFKRIFIWGKL